MNRFVEFYQAERAHGVVGQRFRRRVQAGRGLRQNVKHGLMYRDEDSGLLVIFCEACVCFKDRAVLDADTAGSHLFKTLCGLIKEIPG